MWEAIKNFILKYTDLYHRKVWRPFIKSKYGRPIEKICRVIGKILWVLEVVNPPKGEAPCLAYLFVRFPNRWHGKPFRERLKYIRKVLKELKKSKKSSKSS